MGSIGDKMKTYGIVPVPAPRMTRSDKWKQRPCVMRYFAFRDQVKAHKIELQSPCKITFYIPMPETWSKRKKKDFAGKPHMNKPDLDNLIKALLDSVFSEDAHMWSLSAEKYWAEEGAITVEKFPQDVYLP